MYIITCCMSGGHRRDHTLPQIYPKPRFHAPRRERAERRAERRDGTRAATGRSDYDRLAATESDVNPRGDTRDGLARSIA